jgi:thioredoxin-like negative regulator of GroEL
MDELKNQNQVEALMGPDSGSVVIAESLTDEPIRLFKLNTEAHPKLAAPFHIRALPTTLLIHNGEIMDVVVGSMNHARIAKKAQWLMSKARGEGFFDRLLGRKKEESPASEG